MEGVKLPSIRNIFRLLKSCPTIDDAGEVVPDPDAILTGSPVALLVGHGGLGAHAPALKKLSTISQELSIEAEKPLVIVIFLPISADPAEVAKELKRLRGNAGPQIRWFAIFGLPLEAEIFVDQAAPEQEMMVLVLDIVASVSGSLALYGADGRGLSTEGLKILEVHGAESWPFSEERIVLLEKEKEENIAAKQSLDVLLVTKERDWLLRDFKEGVVGEGPKEERVCVQDLKKGFVGIYFSAEWCPPCDEFLPLLVAVYKAAQANGGSFEVVFVSSDSDIHSFTRHFAKMPWLALPFWDSAARNWLTDYFEVRGIPYLVILGPDGKTITKEGRDLVTELGPAGFPFSKERVEEARSEKRAEIELLKSEQSLKGLLVRGERNWIVDSMNVKLMVDDLTATNITGIFFSAHWSYSSQEFSAKLREAYLDARAAGASLEIISVSLDRSLKDFESEMKDAPWLHLPFEDFEGRRFLQEYFGNKGSPLLVLLGKDGQTIATDGVERIQKQGAKAFLL